MRPLPTEPVAGAPTYLRGVAIVRGEPVPVVDVAQLLHGQASSASTRFVTLRLGSRRVALSVDSVIGVGDMPRETLEALPPLLHDAPRDVIAQIGVLDSALIVALQSARLVPDEVWAAIEANETRA